MELKTIDNLFFFASNDLVLATPACITNDIMAKQNGKDIVASGSEIGYMVLK